MIDPARWIIVEAWLSLGLRLEWCPSWEADRVPKEAWQNVDGADFVYHGGGVWWVRDPGRRRIGQPAYTVPQLSTGALKHELAHWLTAGADERGAQNFGVTETNGAEIEDRVALSESVIDAMLVACARIASMALGGGER